MSELHIPVLFLVFNRLNVTKQVFAAIATAKPPRIYIACDGARVNKPGEDKLVKELRDYLLANIHWDCEVKTLFRQNNLGCGKAVSEAISWFFEHEEMGIILEDDCLPSDSFFSFCQEMLLKYQADKRIWHIGGYSVLHNNELTVSSYYFSQMTQIWGWATWRDRWQEYDLWMSKYPEWIRGNYLQRFAPGFRLKLWHKQLFESNVGLSDTWDCQWYFTALINNGMSITPRISLAQNLGFGNIDSAHPEAENEVVKTIAANNIDFPLQHPPFLCIDSGLDAVYFKWRTKNGVILKALAKPIRKIDEVLFNKKLINTYKKLFIR